MKTFLVSLRLFIGEYEKVTHKLIEANDEYDAGTFALFCESHNTQHLEWDDGLQGVTDMDMRYVVTRTKELTSLENYSIRGMLSSNAYDQESLDKAGDYADVSK